jgi:aminopeptidase N
MSNKNIVAIGGGGFGRSLGELKIEKYITSLVKKERPKICFIPTASGDNDSYKLNFYRAFSKLNCITSHLDFFSRTENLEKKILSQDIIYVGGGNTKSMLAVWKEWDLQNILKIAYEKGIIMSGVSAGAICWFDQGITDSFSDKLEIINCLGIIKGIACPHYDEEKEREPFVKKIIKNQRIDSCICIEGNCALHIKNDFNYLSINFGNKKKCIKISRENNELIKEYFKNYDCI